MAISAKHDINQPDKTNPAAMKCIMIIIITADLRHLSGFIAEITLKAKRLAAEVL